MAEQGKRVASSGAHKGGKVAALVCGILVAVLAVAYLSLCAFVGTGDSLFPNTTAAGVPLGGMDRSAAALRLEDELSRRMEGMTLSFRCGDKLYYVPGSAFTVHADEAAAALSEGQNGSFLVRGVQYLGAMLRPQDQAVAVTLDATPPSVVMALAEWEDANASTTWRVSGHELVFTKGRTGRRVDLDALLSGLGSEAERMLNQRSGQLAPVEASVSESAPAEPDYEAIKTQVYREVSDAWFDEETKAVIPSVTGLALDVDKAKAALDQCREGAQCRVPLVETAPQTSTEDLNALLFREVLGQAKTRCTGTQSRINNVRIAAGFMNNVVLLPGEVFSYLGTCGPYNVDKGYQEGLAYHGGKTVLSVGGGVCQGSSTLYYAVLRANLEVVERYNHGYEPSYIPGGMDATVASTVLDFKFKNNTEYPIRIESYMDEKNNIFVILHGTNTTGIHGEPYSKNRTVTRYAETVYEPKEDVPLGTQVKDPERTAYNGVTVEAWQKLVDAEGNVVEEYKLYTDKYASRNAVIFYNPADADLWNIDPETGRIRETPPEPTPDPAVTPDPVVTPDPAVTTDPTTPPDPAETPGGLPTPPPELPGEGDAPLLPSDQPTYTPPPEEPDTPEPTPGDVFVPPVV